MKCRLTGLEGKPVDAHIIPRAFYEIAPDAEGPHRVVSNVVGEHPRRSPIGIYDRTIVTEDGERYFSPWDTYGADLLLHEREQLLPLMNGKTIVGYRREKYDYRMLKLFALSLIWRAGVSSQPFFGKVQLGRHEDQIRKILLTSDPGDAEFYSVIFATWSDQDRGPGMMDPFRERYEQVNFYRLYLGNYICYVKIDRRPTPENPSRVQLNPNGPLVVIARELARSKELPIMTDIVKRYAR